MKTRKTVPCADCCDGCENNKKTQTLILWGIGAALFVIALIFDFEKWINITFYIASYLLIGAMVLLKAGGNILRGRVFDENFLMSIATIGAFAIGEYPEAVAVMLFYRIGELFQSMAVNRSKKSIAALMDIRPDYANLQKGEDTVRVHPDAVNIGDIIIIKPGEKVPLDGIVIQGASSLNMSALTGESIPKDVSLGSDVLSGSINLNGLLKASVSKSFGESTVSRILDLVQNAGSKKAVAESFITRFARYYTPAVVLAAVALATLPPLLTGDAFSVWLYRALVFLVVSCPCALVISIPLGFFGGIGGASRAGILVKGGNYLEALARVDTVVFDKTGTLTQGVFSVIRTVATGSLTDQEMLELAAHAESYSNHPIAQSIKEAYGNDIDKEKVKDVQEAAGQGIRANVAGRTVLVGNQLFMHNNGIAHAATSGDGTQVHIAVDGTYAGFIEIADEIKNDAQNAILQLRGQGVKNIVMLSGDSEAAAQRVGEQLSLDAVYAKLLPDQKVTMLESLIAKKKTKGSVVYAGDGINDAPVIARADVGIAMGGLGSDAAIEAADVVLMTDEPQKLASAIRIARKTRRIVWQNVMLAFGVKAAVLILGAGGIASMWEAVFADVGVALLAVLNAMRALKVSKY